MKYTRITVITALLHPQSAKGPYFTHKLRKKTERRGTRSIQCANQYNYSPSTKWQSDYITCVAISVLEKSSRDPQPTMLVHAHPTAAIPECKRGGREGMGRKGESGKGTLTDYQKEK